GGDRLSAHRQVPAAHFAFGGDRFDDQLLRGLYQLFSRWRDRRHHRGRADAHIPPRLRFRTEARAAGSQAQSDDGAGSRNMIEILLLPFTFPFMQQAMAIAVLAALPMGLLSPLLVLKGWSL